VSEVGHIFYAFSCVIICYIKFTVIYLHSWQYNNWIISQHFPAPRHKVLYMFCLGGMYSVAMCRLATFHPSVSLFYNLNIHCPLNASKVPNPLNVFKCKWFPSLSVIWWNHRLSVPSNI
jgi:hypothetical protein